jgi:hypothetical protein
MIYLFARVALSPLFYFFMYIQFHKYSSSAYNLIPSINLLNYGTRMHGEILYYL